MSISFALHISGEKLRADRVDLGSVSALSFHPELQAGAGSRGLHVPDRVPDETSLVINNKE